MRIEWGQGNSIDVSDAVLYYVVLGLLVTVVILVK